MVFVLENECDKAFERFKELVKEFKDYTEADTRAKLIDPIFKEVLRWSEDDVSRETHIRPGYLDYLFSTNGTKRFVLEAKREGEIFSIPDSFGNRTYKISGTISTNKKIIKAIEQTHEYCFRSGVNYGIVSNGHQYIIFEAFRFQDDWRNGKCTIFRSMKDIEKDFTLFWNILNRRSVEEGSLRRMISQGGISRDFYRPLDGVHAKESTITRNDMSPLMQPIIDHAFTSITEYSKLDVLKNCYVSRQQYQDASIIISRHFDRPPGFAEKYKTRLVIESEVAAGGFRKIYEKYEEFLRKDAPEGTLILLMGGIGSGKTTFIHNFFNFVIKKPENTLWFYVNFLEASPEPSRIEEHIYKSIIHEFEQKYYKTLREEISSLGLGSIEPTIESITLLCSLLTLKGYTIALVLDNVDQHSYVSPEYQERAVLFAKHLKERLKTLTILTLREESFFRSTMSGVLDAFPVAVFHISSPAFEEVARARIDYVLELLKKEDFLEPGLDKDEVRLFFEIVKNSFRSTRRKGKEILRFIDDISGGDMRLALHFFATFLVSGNTDVDEMLRIERDSRARGKWGYQIPFHHVIKSIMLEHSRLYSCTRSRIMNLFEVDLEHTESHFIHLHVLNYLYNRMSYHPRQGRGYVNIDGILREADRDLINRSAIAGSLKQMALFGLVQFENQSKEGYENAAFVRITNTGIYYLKELCNKFVYLDLVWMDTPISKKGIMQQMMKNLVELELEKSQSDLDRRFARTETFLEYLEKMEMEEFGLNPIFNDSDLTKRRFVSAIIKSYLEQKAYIKEVRASREPMQSNLPD